MDFEEFMKGHQELEAEINPYDALALEPKSKNDPFHVAQLLQMDLAKLDSLSKKDAVNYSLDVLEGLTTEGMTENRLAISSFRLCVLDDTTLRSLNIRNRSLVSGNFQEFVFGIFDGNESYACQLTDPYFIDPKIEGVPGSLLHIDKVAIPVGTISHWGLLPRND